MLKQVGYRLIWHATIWTLWKARNDKIFNNGVSVFKENPEIQYDVPSQSSMIHTTYNCSFLCVTTYSSLEIIHCCLCEGIHFFSSSETS